MTFPLFNWAGQDIGSFLVRPLLFEVVISKINAKPDRRRVFASFNLLIREECHGFKVKISSRQRRIKAYRHTVLAPFELLCIKTSSSRYANPLAML